MRIPHRPFPRRCTGLMLAASLGGGIAAADDHVAVKVSANRPYVEARRTETGELRKESYVFLEGEFVQGPIRDKSLETAEIAEIAQTLAPFLARRNYLPTDDAGTADIVIAVHWGMTTSLRHNTDYVAQLMDQARQTQMANREFAESTYGPALNDPEAPAQGDFAQEMLKVAAREAAAMPNYDWANMASSLSERDFGNRPIASVLGFSEMLHRDSRLAFASEETKTLMHYLNEERYFVVLMAYDLKRRASGEPYERLWVARLSIPAAGINFPTALTRMGKSASDHFGEHIPDLQIKSTPRQDHTGEVEVGDLIVVEEEPE